MEPIASDTSSSPAQDTKGRWWIPNWLKRLTRKKTVEEITGIKVAPVEVKAEPVVSVEEVKPVRNKRIEEMKELIEQENNPKIFQGGCKLSADQAMKLVYWISIFKKNSEIRELCKEEFGLEISNPMIDSYRYRDEYRDFIQKIRNKWGTDLLHVELSHKRRRLEEIEKIYAKSMEKDEFKSALSALCQMQHEVEKDVQNVTLTQVNIYKDMTDAELEEERLKSLERIKQLKGELPCPAEPKKSENPENKDEKNV